MKYGKLFAAAVGLMVLTAVPAYGAQDEEVEAVIALSQMGSKHHDGHEPVPGR